MVKALVSRSRGLRFDPGLGSDLLRPLHSLRVVVDSASSPSNEMKNRGPVCGRRVDVKEPTAVENAVLAKFCENFNFMD